jgi:pyruvate dehydrogenase E2 component (dihydrolipoamide acetyltransferase)
MTDVLMPQMGESIVEGTVTKWLKKVGDKVERDEPLLEISTDKVDSEVPAPVAGTVEEMLVPEGETVEINTVVARIGDGSGAGQAQQQEAATNGEESHASTASASTAVTAAETVPEPSTPPATPEPTPAPADDGDSVRSSPLVRRLAKEHGIDLRQVRGTGQGGRISKKDVEAFLEVRSQAAAASAPSPAGLPDTFPAAPQARFGDYRAEPLNIMRKKIAEHMVLTKRVSPHVSTIHQVDVTRVARLRETNKQTFFEQTGVKLTFMPFFLRAAASALKKFPVVNASLDGEQIIFHSDVNVGVAVALEDGLLVPVIRNVDRKNAAALQQELADLAERARGKQLKPEEVHQGTFSISNYGSFGSLLATPAINQPQAAILGVGAIHKAPVVIDDAIAIRSICYVTLSFDHRLLDGAVGDQFVSHLKGIIENWSEELL